ncbi:MAG TPA: ATP-binding protein [Usitatibacter sp.]|nr:ATP-binding protein [Usitatibacter sp.]
MDLSRFEALFEQAPLSMQLLARGGRTLRVNKAWKSLWAPDSDELTRWVLSEYNVLEDPQLERSGIAALLRKAFAGESVELPTIRYDPAEAGKPGPARWVRAYAHPIKDADGQVREVMLIHEDVSERIAADAAIRSAEERLRIAVLAGNIGIWDWDLLRDVVTWSPKVFELHGLPPEADGRPAAEFTALVHDDDRNAVHEKLRVAIERREGFSSEYRAVLPDGSTRWLSTWATTVVDAQGVPFRMVGAVISVDAYKRAEAALRDTDQRKDEFLAMLAHELRNPLAPIRTSAEILRLAATDPQRVRASAEVIDRQVRHLTELMDDLLDVSRVTRGLITLEREDVDLARVIHTAIEQASHLLHAKGHALSVNMQAGEAHVLGDRARLVQIVANLLNNAARYTPNGGRIEVALTTAGDTVELRVSDNGSGIEAGFLPQLFELFTQGERMPDRSQGGLGLGLALVKRLVELHGGTVAARSAGPGQGATFIVTLPASHNRPTSGEAVGPVLQGDGHPLRILVVDDNRDAAESLAVLLESMGHAVEVRYDADAVLAASGLDGFDAFVIDIGLPGRDGRSLARALRERGIAATLIALTGYGQPADRALSLESGFDHHLVKPIESAALVAVLRPREMS